MGASGGIGKSLVKMMLRSKVCIGCHFATGGDNLREFHDSERVKLFPMVFNSPSDCKQLVEEFCKWAGRIDGLVVLAGGIKRAVHWEEIEAREWDHDIFLNLSVPFFLSRAAIQKMRKTGSGGRIILTGTESALHGGSSTSLAYGAAKMGVECLVKGLARDGAKDKILVDGIRPGFILTGFHERWQGKNRSDLEKRADMVPLKRPGSPEEVSALILYLLSGWAGYITGQMFPITGGDWL